MKVLVVTHWPSQSTISRSMELARELAAHRPVCWLDWDIPDFSSSHLYGRLLERTRHWLLRSRQDIDTRAVGNLTFVKMPYVLPRPYSPHRDEYAWEFNAGSLSRIIEREGISHVVNANALFFPTSHLRDPIRVVYDVVDDQTAIAGSSRASVERFMEKEIYAADAVATISHGLRDMVHQKYGVDAVRIPNGGNPAMFEGLSNESLLHVRRQYGLEGKKVIGCVGNHNHWAGLRLLVDAFELLRRRVPDVVLFVVGPGSEVSELMRGPQSEGLILTGPVPPKDIAPYFGVLTVGTLPFTHEPFTENSLPLKILEYGFARKLVVASPLNELKRLAFPHVRLVERRAEAWSRALEEALSDPWESSWDAALQGYRWSDLALQLLECLEQ